VRNDVISDQVSLVAVVIKIKSMILYQQAASELRCNRFHHCRLW